jgi:Cu(I)-responsive transcriptional regulator
VCSEISGIVFVSAPSWARVVLDACYAVSVVTADSHDRGILNLDTVVRSKEIAGETMNIGNASKASGLSTKMIRYYEGVGLLPKAARRQSNYRDYGDSDIHRLIFVRRARELGFDVELIRNLLSLWSDRRKPCLEVRAIAVEQVARLQAQATHLQEMISTLDRLIASCRRGTRPECPIIMELSSQEKARATKGKSGGSRPRNFRRRAKGKAA